MRERTQGILLFYIVVWCISPPLGYGMPYRIAAFLALAVIIGNYFYSKNFQLTKYELALIFLLCYMLAINLFSGDGLENRIGTYIMLVMALTMGIWDRESDFKAFVWIIPATFLLFIAWNLCTLNAIEEVPTIMRILAKNGSDSSSYAMRGVGGYGYLYTVLAALPIGFGYFFSEKKRMKRIITAVFIISTYVVIFQSQYYMAMIIAMIMPLIYMVCRIKNKTMRFIFIVSLIAIGMVVYFNLDKILLELIEISDVRSITIKLKETYNILVEGGDIANSEFSTRYDRYLSDLRYIVGHPLLGGLSYNVTGNHSALLDYIAQYGVFVGGLFTWCLFSQPYNPDRNIFSVGNTIRIVVFILSVFNVIPFAMGSVLFILIPLYYSSIERQKE